MFLLELSQVSEAEVLIHQAAPERARVIWRD
jgi:hypothetical protein